MLYEYAGLKFRANFGFAYNGNKSNPPDRKLNGAVRGYQELLHTYISPTSAQEVEHWLDDEVFKYVSSTIFHIHCSS